MHVIDYGKPEDIKLITEDALRMLKEYAGRFKFECDIEIGTGIASNAIMNESIIKGSTVIVIGKKGRSVIKDLLLGSTADGIMRIYVTGFAHFM